jgi:alkanesulfonate monooxygenase SsuD/methylene tetrahydromethanopterin reductase-like flavin-dependent oxidoreductase (luciferase family)
LDTRYGINLPVYVGDRKLAKAGPVHLGVWDYPFLNSVTWTEILKIAQKAEKLGYDSVWGADHLAFGKDGAILNSWTVLSALSSVTSKLKLGTLVLCNSYRNPALVAKMASTLAIISSNRFVLGYGAGWYGLEYRMFGYDYPPPAERIAMLREALIVIRGLLEKSPFSFSGKYYRLDDAVALPRPTKRVPILLGGFGKQTLRLVAEYADAWDIGVNVSLPQYRERVEFLKGELKKRGRSFDDVRRSMHFQVMMADSEEELRRKKKVIKGIVDRAIPRLTDKPSPDFAVDIDNGIVGTPDQIRRKLRAYSEAGCERFILSFLDYPGSDVLERFASEFM